VVKSKKKISGDREAVEDEGDAEMLEKIPFACIICEGPYKQPVVTRCGHYFCEACALKRYRKDPTCKNCGAATMGVFNTASKLEGLLRRKREREEKPRAAQERDE
jgi:RING finger protein 113A